MGSVKSNIGHLEASSALASVIKVVQCLEKGQIPPQMHFKEPNPKISFESVSIPTEMVPWPSTKGDIRRAAINTFGAGGTNGHAVLEAYPVTPSEPVVITERPYLFKVSASEDCSLRASSLAYAQYIEKHKPNLQDLAYTLLKRRSTLRKSIYFAAGTHEEAIQSLRSETLRIYPKPSLTPGRKVFVFTGQGVQW